MRRKKDMSKLAKKLATSIGQAAIEDLARQTKFVQRSSELGGFDFALLNMKSIDSDGFSSLTEQCVKLGKDYEVNISKQGLDKRYSTKSTSFMQALFLRRLLGRIRRMDKFLPNTFSFQLEPYQKVL